MNINTAPVFIMTFLLKTINFSQPVLPQRCFYAVCSCWSNAIVGNVHRVHALTDPGTVIKAGNQSRKLSLKLST